MDTNKGNDPDLDPDPDAQALSRLIQAHATRHAAPASLRAGLRTQAALADASCPPAGLHRAGRRQRWSWRGWRSGAAGFALGLACMAVVAPLLQQLEQEASMDGDMVASHVRALQVGPLTEVASTDRHTVKPWFQGKLDFAPPVLDLADAGFPLLGGRTEQLRGQVVATLAYTRGQHVIDVYVWPSAHKKTPVRSVHRGFNLLSWSDGAMQFWAVSDLDRHELGQFAQLWRDRLAAQ